MPAPGALPGFGLDSRGETPGGHLDDHGHT
jgi:hypothetical protein